MKGFGDKHFDRDKSPPVRGTAVAFKYAIDNQLAWKRNWVLLTMTVEQDKQHVYIQWNIVNKEPSGITKLLFQDRLLDYKD